MDLKSRFENFKTTWAFYSFKQKLQFVALIVLILGIPAIVGAVATVQYIRSNAAGPIPVTPPITPPITPPSTPTPTPTPFIKVFYPNGGQSFTPNQTTTIFWSSLGIDKVAIDIVDANGAFSTIALPMAASLGKFTWNIPSTWYGTSNKFIVKIYSYPEKTIFDTSDTQFTISYPTPTPTPTRTPIATTPTPTPRPATPTPTPLPICNIADLNKDGAVDSKDVDIFTSQIFTASTISDINHDGIVDIIDYSIIVKNYLKLTGTCK